MKPRLVAVDLGFGWTNVTDGEHSLTFPSVVSQATNLFEIKDDDIVLTDLYSRNRKYFIGHSAVRQGEMPTLNINSNKVEQRNTRLLADAALAYGGYQDINVVTGLPVDHYFNQKDQMQDLLRCYEYKRLVCQYGHTVRDVRVTVRDFRIIPQPLGSLLDEVLDRSGKIANKKLASQLVLIVDIGFYTLDVLAVNAMTLMQPMSFSRPYGVSLAYRSISKQLGGVPLYQVDKMVLQDSRPYEDFFRNLAELIDAELESMNAEFDTYLLTGGGSKLLYPWLLARKNKVLAENANTANVNGYYKLGVRTWGENIS